ncbi:MAG: flippase activity-associated protein Agl23 [Haloferacaceae archaeon]
MPADGPASSDRALDRVTLAVAALAALALLARLVGLGSRPFHWDEARVGYWTLRYLDTGVYSYRPVAGGPFLYLVNRWVFALLGATDATARLVVALAGGLLPLAALLYRERLDDLETVALAAFLAASPLLVYYSRFLRGDLPLAAFSLVAVGAFVRAYDGDRRFLYLGAAALGLAATTSGFFVGTLACTTAAGLLVFDHQRLLGEGRTATARVRGLVQGAGRLATPAARVVLVVVAVVLVFYTPRGGDVSLARPGTWTYALDAALFGTVEKFYSVRVALRAREAAHPLVPFVGDAVKLLAYAALPTSLLAVGAFLRDRYSAGGPRPVVAFHAYWGFAGLLVFPVITELSAPWILVHVVTPLAVPAAVGTAGLVRYGVSAFRRDDAGRAVAAVLVLVAVGGQAGAVTASGVYGPSEPQNRFAQYAQPNSGLDGFYEDVLAASAGNDGTDVLFYGQRFYLTDERAADEPPVPDQWGNRLPLPWYLERAGATTDSATSLSTYDGEIPPVVVADPAARDDLARRLTGYEATEYELALWDRNVVVFVRSD